MDLRTASTRSKLTNEVIITSFLGSVLVQEAVTVNFTAAVRMSGGGEE